MSKAITVIPGTSRVVLMDFFISVATYRTMGTVHKNSKSDSSEANRSGN